MEPRTHSSGGSNLHSRQRALENLGKLRMPPPRFLFGREEANER
jgi:hypothetical protein